MSDLITSYLDLALRWLRLEAALARAEAGTLGSDERAALAAQLGEARTASLELRRQDGLPIGRVSERLGLRQVDEAVLLVAAALELDPVLGIIAAALGGDDPRHGVTARLLTQVLRVDADVAATLRLGDDHPLVRSGLLEPGGSTGMVEAARPWRAAARTVAYLSGRDTADPILEAYGGGVIEIGEEVRLDHLADELQQVQRVIASGEQVLLVLEGADGSGRRTLAAAAARALGQRAVALDAAHLTSDPASLTTAMRALRRESWLLGAVPVLARLDTVRRRENGADLVSLAVRSLEARGAVAGAAVLTLADGSELPELGRRAIRVRIPTPIPPVREALWRAALGDARLDDEAAGGLAIVAQRYALTPGAIQRSAANARTLSGDEPVHIATLHAGVSSEVQERFGGLATRLVVKHRWEDLVLPVDTLDEVRAFVSRASNAAMVYDSWGFRTRLQRGLGLSALFSGPPGTGKTMVAGLIAQSMGLDLYIIDLASLVSKWVGETEKNLARIFDAASMGQAVLLFDEADSLFSRRTDVKSATDRYANLEVNYLLQRIESYTGVAILTTNLEGAINPAFKRRLAADVRFYAPEAAERSRLWQKLLPPEAPTEGDLNYDRLAEKYKELAGGHIRNAVLRAAFLAAAEGKAISQAHLERAARVEVHSMGKLV